MILFLVHGFVEAEYDAIEGDRLEVLFQLNVKGETASRTLTTSRLSGSITAEAGGTASELYSHCNGQMMYICGEHIIFVHYSELVPAIKYLNSQLNKWHDIECIYTMLVCQSSSL